MSHSKHKIISLCSSNQLNYFYLCFLSKLVDIAYHVTSYRKN